ncbi:uncharacterized protein BP5553_10143 [Venustampulla echinocandica]|uniref:Uncharacterized protein n=1 Tax=Venustampulla echinocandica TaxID=2656787 RepID=A0A370TAG0_9HELO|nr:uncharacterized protein BP5553_10143 [Venustampulla echinocandica]RDL30798.1 hypothetical protein BP5553_10143 [Venustampulla echinocandica]
MYSPLLVNVAILSTLVGHGLAHKWFVPYSDSSCKNRTDDGSHRLSVEGNTVNNWKITQGYPGQTPFWDVSFPSATSAPGGSGKQVWWKLDERADPGCRIQLMQEYTQGGYGNVVPGMPWGNVFISADQPGCYFSQLRDKAQLGGTFCCGHDDCTAMNAGNHALDRRQLEEYEHDSGTVIEARGGSVAARAAEVVSQMKPTPEELSVITEDSVSKRDEFGDCKAEDMIGPFINAGKQTMIGSVQTCTSSPCTFSSSSAIGVSSTLSQSKTTTVDVGGQMSVTVTAGLAWPFAATGSTTIGASISRAVAQGTDTSMTNSTTVTVANTFGLPLGTTGFATFTATYKCWSAKVSCGGNKTPGWTLCHPQLNADKSIQGDFNVVIVG